MSGRPQAHPARRERTISSRARGALPEDFHGPLQRLLEDALIGATVRVRLRRRKTTRHSRPISAPVRWEQSHSAPGAQRNRRGCCVSSLRWRAPRPRATLLPAARAQTLRQPKGLGLKIPALHDVQDESWLRTLTVKLRGRPEAPDQAPRAHNLFRARGAEPEAHHGPLQRLLGVRRTIPNAHLRSNPGVSQPRLLR